MLKIHSTTLAEYVGTEFDVLDDPSNRLRITLTNIVEHAKTEQQETFSLFFHGPSIPPMKQGMRTLRHDRLGELSVFLVPIGQDAEGFQYEAVFNYMLQ